MQTCKIVISIMSVLVALVPFLNDYAMPGLGVNVGLCVLVMFVALAFIKRPFYLKHNLIARDVILYVLLIYLFICSFAAFVRGDCDLSVLGNVLFTYIVLLPAVQRLNFIDKELMMKTIEVMAIIGGIVICFQYLFFYVFGFNDLWFWIPFDSWTYTYANNSAKSALVNGVLFRPSGIFTEPSHYSVYASIALAYRLFHSEKIADIAGIFITITTILSTSGMGIVFVMFIWAYYLVVCDVSKQSKVILLCSAVIVATLAFAYLYRFEFFRFTLERVFFTNGRFENAYAGRTFTSYILDDLNLTQRWFGMGYRNEPTQLNSLGEPVGLFMVAIVELQFCIGYIGTALFLALCVYLMIKAREFNRLVMIIYIMNVFIAAVVNLTSLFFYAAVVSELFLDGKYESNHQKSTDITI
ncbi:hypothetical protein [uncultured Cloacibacillus sp.]|uniref:hypothetical protein n=1 Tax=uncultured Cloacibacillus sp. TaxID=889794 RepID=UPI0026DCF58C|nr:hypothetical protein [uncultured Cloacibacillus sp.]